MGQYTIYVDNHIFDISLEAWQGADQIFYKAKQITIGIKQKGLVQ
jgi:hypothetical protein